MMGNQFFINRGEKLKGPFSTEDVRSLIKTKKLKPSDGISASSDGPWQPLGDIYKSILRGESIDTSPEAEKETSATPVPDKMQDEGQSLTDDEILSHLMATDDGYASTNAETTRADDVADETDTEDISEHPSTGTIWGVAGLSQPTVTLQFTDQRWVTEHPRYPQLRGRLNVENLTNYDIYQLFVNLELRAGHVKVGEAVESLQHLPAGEKCTWIVKAFLDAAAYDTHNISWQGAMVDSSGNDASPGDVATLTLEGTPHEEVPATTVLKHLAKKWAKQWSLFFLLFFPAFYVVFSFMLWDWSWPLKLFGGK